MLVMIGASASGKTEAAKKIISKYGFEKMITYTTRPIRESEIDGIDYHFLSKEQFLDKMARDEFLETTLYRDHYYGTMFKDADFRKVLIVDPNGANKIYEKLKDDVTIVYLNSPKEIRHQRMIDRKDNPAEIKKRLENDDFYFHPDNICHIDFIIDSFNCTIEQLSDEIYQLYMKKRSNL